ncbi:MAG: hypothetical protein J3K34DRAFT_423364, partial [Monoraphidium minutum]
MCFKTLPLAAGCLVSCSEAFPYLILCACPAWGALGARVVLAGGRLLRCGRRAELPPTCGPQATAVRRVYAGGCGVGSAACSRRGIAGGGTGWQNHGFWGFPPWCHCGLLTLPRRVLAGGPRCTLCF